MYYAYPPNFDYRFYSVPAFPINETDYYFEPGYNTYRQIEIDCTDAAKMNAVLDYSVKHFQPEHPDHLGAFPNFEEGRENGQHRYQVVLFYNKTADFYHAPISQFGDIDRRNIEAMMIAADRVAEQQGRTAGLPTFHKGPNDYGMFLFKNEAVEINYVSLGELGNPRNVRDLFIAVNRKARSQRYESGFPTFTKDAQGSYKVVLIKDDYAELRSVASSDLNLQEYYERFCGPGPGGGGVGDDELKLLDDLYKIQVWPNQNEFGVRLGNEVIAYLIGKIPATYETNTDYNKRKVEDFKFKGLNIATNEIDITCKFNVRKYEKYVGQTLNVTYNVTAAIKLGVKNRTFTYHTRVKKVESGFPEGVLGALISIFDLLFRTIGIVVEQEDPGKLSDAIATIAAAVATGSQAAERVRIQNKCVNEIINQGIIYPSDVRMDDKGVWFVFKYEQPNLQKLMDVMNACGVDLSNFIQR
jgi:hypothetical protein